MATIFLDLDGTLVDPYPGISACFIHALEAMGLPAPPRDSLRWVVGPALIDSFRQAGVDDPDRALQLYRARYAKTGLFEADVYDRIPAALAALRQAGHVLHLATAKPHVYARRITAHFGLDRFLSQQYGPELDGTRNDKGALLAHALAELGTDAAQCFMVGDRHHDTDAARAVAMRSVAVCWGFGEPGEWRQADAICETPSALAAYFST